MLALSGYQGAPCSLTCGVRVTRDGRTPKLPHSTPPAMTSMDKLTDQRQHQSKGGWQGLVLPPRRADDPPAQCRLQTAGPGGQRLELRDGTHLGPGCHRLEVSLPRGVVTRGDPLSLTRPATASCQHSSSRHPLGLRCSHLPFSLQTHAGDMGTSRTWGWRQPRAHVHRSTRARSTALGPHPQVRSLCPEGQQETGQPGWPQQVNLRCRPVGSGRGRTAPSGEDACPLWELLLACSWASAETMRT